MHAYSLQKCVWTRIYTHVYTYTHVHIYMHTCIHWLKVDSRETRNRIYKATTIANSLPGGPPVPRQPDNPSRRVPFHHSANLINMPQAGMLREEDGTLWVPQWNCTLSGTPLIPELDSIDTEAGLAQIVTPWSENDTKLMNRLFPSLDTLCLNFGRTGVFQWNYPNSSTLTQTTEWPQRSAGDTPLEI